MHYPETYLDEYNQAFEKMTKTVEQFIQTHERETVMGKVKQLTDQEVLADLEATKGPVTTDITTTLNERGTRYGRFVDQAELSQCLKQCVQSHLRMVNNSLTPDQQEALDMILHKIARIANGDPNYADSWIDVAGYAKLVSDRLEGVVR